MVREIQDGTEPATIRFFRIMIGIRLSGSALPEEGDITSVACLIRISGQLRTRIDLRKFLFSQIICEGHYLED